MAKADILFTNAAIQNRSYSLEDVPGKMAGIAAAQVLNVLHDNSDVVHSWNNVGMFGESEDADATTRLNDKYQSTVMQRHVDYWDAKQQLQVIADDDPTFSEWSIDIIGKCLDQGNVYIEKAEFHVCNDCDLVIAESVVDITTCGTCDGTNLTSTKEAALFVDMPDDRLSLLPYGTVYNAINTRQEQASLLQVPPRLLLSRDRKNGIELGEIGLKGRKLDPRLGIGMLAVFVAAERDYSQVCLVQSTSTLVRTVPYLMGVIPNADKIGVPRPRFAAHTKIDTKLLTDPSITPIEREFLLPLASLRRKQDVRANDLAGIRNEFTKAGVKAEAIQEIFKRLQLVDISGGNTDNELDALIDEGRLNDLLPTLNRAFGKSIETTKRLNQDDVQESDRDDAAIINDMLATFYRFVR